jgi:hypothetical protein
MNSYTDYQMAKLWQKLHISSTIAERRNEFYVHLQMTTDYYDGIIFAPN